MDARRASYSYFSYPYSWKYPYSQSQYINYASSMPVRRNANQPLPQQQKSGSEEKKTDYKVLVAVIVVLAMLLFAAIVALVVVGVMLQEKVSAPESDELMTTTTAQTESATIIGFNVTRTNILFDAEMEDPSTTVFSLTCILFCDMVCSTWLQNTLTRDQCSCAQFMPGSVIADIRLSFPQSAGAPDGIVNALRAAIPPSSAADPNTEPVLAENIIIIQ